MKVAVWVVTVQSYLALLIIGVFLYPGIMRSLDIEQPPYDAIWRRMMALIISIPATVLFAICCWHICH